jgi:hypothetical protein
MKGAVLMMIWFPPTGLLATVQASRTITLRDAGDLEGARKASQAARKWVIISIWLGALLYLATIAAGVVLIRMVLRYIDTMSQAIG